jgi:hypothetical protein
MRPEQFEREKEYGAALAITKALLAQGLITPVEYRKIKGVLTEKYRPVMGLLRDDPATGNPHPPK